MGCVHDEVLLEAPIEATEEMAQTLKRIMEKAGQTFLKALPVGAEVVVVDTWAEK